MADLRADRPVMTAHSYSTIVMTSVQTITLSSGTVVPSSFDPGLVAAAFFASLVGCLLTVEILHRRGTALGNWRSWLETSACATSMGLIGVWCMHFIGNRAIVLGNGEDSIQLLYSPGWTALSVFLPILGLSGAFAAAEMRLDSLVLHRLTFCLSGILAGLSVVGMHYVGNLGISNYSLHYSPRYFVASFVIAIGNCLITLILFYTWREQWITSWWKRLFCALLLAGGVSAMHFTASTSCTYIFIRYQNDSRSASRNVQVAIAAVLCGATAFLIIGYLSFHHHRHQILDRRSKKFVLACALFDPDGRLLVTHEGLFPSKEITDQYNHRSFGEEFDAAHPVFLWIFRVTHNWSSVIDLLPGMQRHLWDCETDVPNTSPPPALGSRLSHDPETPDDYSVIFRERFCVAAISLAIEMHMPIRRLGVLYDRVVYSGATKAKKSQKYRLADERVESLDDLGSNSEVIGKGQMLIVTRQVTREEASKLLNTGGGFRFAEFSLVRRLLASSLHIPLTAVDGHLERLTRCSSQLHSTGKAGTWLSLFALVPVLTRKCFDVAVQKGNPQQLPDVLLLSNRPNALETRLLHSLQDLTVNSCLRELGSMLQTMGDPVTPEQSFAFVLHRAISELTSSIPNSWLRNARFLAKPLVARYHGKHQANVDETTLYSFYVIIDMHSWDKRLDLDRTPLTFFGVHQRCYPNSPDHAVLVRDIHQEFGPLIARRADRDAQNRHSRRSRLTLNSKSSMWGISQPGNLLSQESVDGSHTDLEMSSHTAHEDQQRVRRADSNWGGILVSSETIMKNDPKQALSIMSSDTTEPMGVNVAVSTLKPEWTFVDELFAVTKARFVRSSF